MRRGKWIVYLMTAVLAAVMFRFALSEARAMAPFSFEAGAETMHFWTSPAGESYVFLPSFAELEDVKLRTKSHIHFDEVTLYDGDSCGGLELNRPYTFSEGRTITFLRSENLPAVYIDTASGTMDYVHEEKDNRESGVLRVYDAEGNSLYRGNLESIKGRGNSTYLYQEKKPYSLKLSAEADLLGMGAAQKWALLANAYDPSHMRNKIVYDFAAKAGLSYAPDSRWVDLYLNGEYAGLYQLCEKNEIHPQRVDIPRNGSFLVSIDRDWGAQDSFVYTDGGVPLRIHQSDLDSHTLADLWQSLENAIRAQDSVDPVTGKPLEALIDMDSWARKYLIEEVFSNTDGGRYSQFFYGTRDKIYAGPVWDYDLALSNPVTYREFEDIGYRDSRYNMFYVKSNGDSWFSSLYQKENFRKLAETIYRQDFLPLLEALPEEIAAYARQIGAAAAMDAIRWNTEEMDTAALQRFAAGRTEFLNSVWVEHQDFFTVRAQFVDRIMEYALLPGENLSQLPPYRAYGWYYAGTDMPVDVNKPVFEDMQIELRKNPDA